MSQATHNDGQTEERTYHNHGNALLEEAAQMLYKSKSRPEKEKKNSGN